MRRLLVSNFITLDGYYESEDKTFGRFFDFFLDEYGQRGIRRLQPGPAPRRRYPHPRRPHLVHRHQGLLDQRAP